MWKSVIIILVMWMQYNAMRNMHNKNKDILFSNMDAFWDELVVCIVMYLCREKNVMFLLCLFASTCR